MCVLSKHVGQAAYYANLGAPDDRPVQPAHRLNNPKIFALQHDFLSMRVVNSSGWHRGINGQTLRHNCSSGVLAYFRKLPIGLNRAHFHAMTLQRGIDCRHLPQLADIGVEQVRRRVVTPHLPHPLLEPAGGVTRHHLALHAAPEAGQQIANVGPSRRRHRSRPPRQAGCECG